MRLALACGRVDVDRMLAEMTSTQLTEWMAYYRLEKFGPLTEERRSAKLLALLGNVYRDHERKPSPYTVEDFMPTYEKDVIERKTKKALSPQGISEKIRRTMRMLGGK
jgi:hypothetical protein